jgi:hypothetical protein
VPTTSSPTAAKQPSVAVLLATSFAVIIVQLDVTIVNVVLSRMDVELGAGSAPCNGWSTPTRSASPAFCCRLE